MIELHDVSLAYGDLMALDGASFQVPLGGVLGLVGRNGAGKSTTISLLAGLLRPNKGHAQIAGLDVGDSDRRLKRLCGFLLADEALFAYLTAGETLDFVAEAFGVAAEERPRRTGDLLSFFGLVEAGNLLVDDYSTGMRKKLALAAALVHAPKVLVLDEPFESLDPLMVRRLKRLLVDFAASGGTVLLSSHLLDAVAEICTHIAILDRGRVLMFGPKQEAVLRITRARATQPTLEELYASVVPDEIAPDISWLRPRPTDVVG